jgi:hypothetical protein
MHFYTSRWLLRGECWFECEEPSERVDVVDYYQMPHPLPRAVCRPFHTYTVSLEEPPELILSRFNQTTRREVRQAREKGEITCQVSTQPTPPEIEQFLGAYAAFATAKGRPPLDTAHLKRLLADRTFWLSFARTATGELLVAHGNYIGKGRMRSTYAVSPLRWHENPKIRQLIGRAGRYLTWLDMMAARDAGLPVYDFGGWYQGAEDTERLSINAYKSGFGGQVVREYHCQRAYTFKGRLAMSSATTLDWLRRVKRDQHARLNLVLAGNWCVTAMVCDSL